MATDLLTHERAERQLIDTTAHDIDELVRRIEYLSDRRAVPPVVALAGVGLMAFVCCVVLLWVLSPLLDIWWLMGSAGLVALSTATAGYAVGRHDGQVAASRTQVELCELLQLLRQTAPVFVQQGKLSELRWAAIKIMLSKYDI